MIETFSHPEATDEEKKVIEEGRKIAFAEYVEEIKIMKQEKEN